MTIARDLYETLGLTHSATNVEVCIQRWMSSPWDVDSPSLPHFAFDCTSRQRRRSKTLHRHSACIHYSQRPRQGNARLSLMNAQRLLQCDLNSKLPILIRTNAFLLERALRRHRRDWENCWRGVHWGIRRRYVTLPRSEEVNAGRTKSVSFPGKFRDCSLTRQPETNVEEQIAIRNSEDFKSHTAGFEVTCFSSSFRYPPVT